MCSGSQAILGGADPAAKHISFCHFSGNSPLTEHITKFRMSVLMQNYQSRLKDAVLN